MCRSGGRRQNSSLQPRKPSARLGHISGTARICPCRVRSVLKWRRLGPLCLDAAAYTHNEFRTLRLRGRLETAWLAVPASGCECRVPTRRQLSTCTASDYPRTPNRLRRGCWTPEYASTFAGECGVTIEGQGFCVPASFLCGASFLVWARSVGSASSSSAACACVYLQAQVRLLQAQARHLRTGSLEPLGGEPGRSGETSIVPLI